MHPYRPLAILALTVVVSKDQILHLESTGFADVATKKPMAPRHAFLDRLDDEADYRHRDSHVAG